MKPLWTFGRRLDESVGQPIEDSPDWQQANPKRIDKALGRALALPSGGWFVVGASRGITTAPRCVRICDRHLVAWRTSQGVRLAPNECPHMGASLAEGLVRDDRLVCPWHGLAIGDEGHGSWKPLPTFDDGVLTWVRLDDEEPGVALSDQPFMAPRPKTFIDGVIQLWAECEPRDVIANRLDPWHGTHFHPYSFGRLKVIDLTEEAVTVRVAKRVLGPFAVEVDATFHCPDPRTIVMTIIGGEGEGSVVETHATPICPGRTAIIEATLATSDRYQFKMAQLVAGFVRPFMERSARRLWVDDAAYAERLYRLRDERPGRYRRHRRPSA